MAVGRSFLVGKSCIHDLGSMGNMVYLYSGKWRDGSRCF